MKTYISVNIVSQALILISTIKKHNCDRVNEVMQLKLPYGINRMAALAFSIQCEWVQINGDVIYFTEQGEFLVNAFNGQMIDQLLWRSILAGYIDKSKPAWAQRILYGRKEAYFIMTAEEQRCFDEAGLMDSTAVEVVEWWDFLAQQERAKKQASKLDIGREGERYTIIYEKNRTGMSPVWTSIESNLAGYDVLSYQTARCRDQRLIEVKTSTKDLNNAVCTITRCEWDLAQKQNNVERYFFYLWLLSEDTPMLAIVSVEEMKLHIPTDNLDGYWKDVEIPFSTFSNFFEPIMLGDLH